MGFFFQLNTAYESSSIRPYYVGSTVTDVLDPATINVSPPGVVFNITVGVNGAFDGGARDVAHALIGSLISTNYSVGGTDLYVDPAFKVQYFGQRLTLFFLFKEQSLTIN